MSEHLTGDQIRAMSQAGDMLKIIAELIVGYRKTLVDGDVGPDVADQMAKDFHDVLLHQMSGQIQAATQRGGHR